jgi:deazaflavin-dependent oxidoreductase (nitroreductase family)
MVGRGTRRSPRADTSRNAPTVFDCFDGTLREYFPATTAMTVEPPRETNGTAIFMAMSGGSRRKDHPNNAPGVPMVYPVVVENFQVKYFNPMIKPIARFIPGFAIIKHRGRKSGTPYETVVTAYRKGEVLAISLGHGKTDWVKNVLAAGEADVHFIRRDVHLTNPRIIPAGSRAEGLPWMARVQADRMAIFVADITGPR